MSANAARVPKPSTPQVNTKIERAVEAIESLTNAVVTLREKPDDDRKAAFEAVVDARQECRDAFEDFLRPIFRVHEQAPKQSDEL